MTNVPRQNTPGFGTKLRLEAHAYQRQEIRVILRGQVCDVSFGWEPQARRLTCFCTCDDWTHEENCRHVRKILEGDMRGVSGDGQLELVQQWDRSAER